MTGILRTRRAAAAALGIAALAIVAAAGAYAATGGGSRITVCVHRQGGGLYQARHCRRHDRKLTWNARGQRGITGLTGPAGRRGPAGARGRAGATGPAGPLLNTLPSGRTETGAFMASAYTSTFPATTSTTISFPIRLASAPAATYVKAGSPPTAACPGSPTAPAAAPGNLCIYESSAQTYTTMGVFNTASDTVGASRFGAGLLFRDDTAGGTSVGAMGTWAVTAP